MDKIEKVVEMIRTAQKLCEKEKPEKFAKFYHSWKVRGSTKYAPSGNTIICKGDPTGEYECEVCKKAREYPKILYNYGEEAITSLKEKNYYWACRLLDLAARLENSFTRGQYWGSILHTFLDPTYSSLELENALDLEKSLRGDTLEPSEPETPVPSVPLDLDLARKLLDQALSSSEQLGRADLVAMAELAIAKLDRGDFQGAIQTLYTAYGIPGSPGIFWDARQTVIEAVQNEK